MSTTSVFKTTPFDPSFGTIVEPCGGAQLNDLACDEVIRLFKEHGLVLFRGFDVPKAMFEDFGNQFSDDFMTYMGGGYIRKVINDDGDKSIMSVNYYKKGKADDGKQRTFALPLHGEMYYIKRRPVLIWFYCVKPALADGETTVCPGAKLHANLTQATKRLFANQRLKYTRLYKEADWMNRFQTDDLSVVKTFCDENDMLVDIDCEKRTVRTDYLQSATIEHPWSGETIFINNILPVIWQERNGKTTNVVRLEDDSEIPPEVVEEIQEVCAVLTRGIEWNEGELAMVDNRRILHGRNRFDDNVRELFSRMVRTVPWE